VGNGGLPTEAEAEAIEKALSRAYDDLESLVWRVEAISNGTGNDVPFPVTLEDVGLLAILADGIESRAKDLQTFAETLRGKLIWIDSIHVEQKRSN
jgi:flavin-binding protein dodecin